MTFFMRAFLNHGANDDSYQERLKNLENFWKKFCPDFFWNWKQLREMADESGRRKLLIYECVR